MSFLNSANVANSLLRAYDPKRQLKSDVTTYNEQLNTGKPNVVLELDGDDIVEPEKDEEVLDDASQVGII
jgi:hypothetical protein